MSGEWEAGLLITHPRPPPHQVADGLQAVQQALLHEVGQALRVIVPVSLHGRPRQEAALGARTRSGHAG
jgi:hypothetical protein